MKHGVGPFRRIPPVIVFLVIAGIILYFQAPTDKEVWRARAQGAAHKMAEKVGMGEKFGDMVKQRPQDLRGAKLGPPGGDGTFIAGQGIPKPPGSNYSRVLVVPKTKKENVDWLQFELRDVETKVYVADDQHAPLHPPANKGHEAMVYLTYIIDNYENLPDIMIFMHNHRRAWHNNDVLNSDAADMIRRLSSERVTREGYMNLRCQWYPGCPDWMHPGNTKFDIQKTEQVLIARAWAEIFPNLPVPDVLAQPCCSQFALSKALVRSIPKETFEYYRDWILNTKLKDFISGRVWEYMWQVAFTGASSWCPVEHACYCDGYGVCFGAKKNYDAWFSLKRERDQINRKLLQWYDKDRKIKQAIEEGRDSDALHLEKPEEGKDLEYKLQIRSLNKEMDVRKEEALKRGEDPRNRALESGREWKEGDGF